MGFSRQEYWSGVPLPSLLQLKKKKYDKLMVKNLPANAGDIKDMRSVPGSEDPLEEGMEIHSSILAWRIP